MLEQLNTYMTTLNLLPDYILAYRIKNLSTETVLVRIHHDILKAFEEICQQHLTLWIVNCNNGPGKHVWYWWTGIGVVQ